MLGAMSELGWKGEERKGTHGDAGSDVGHLPGVGASLAGVCMMLVSMETQQMMCFHRAAASKAGGPQCGLQSPLWWHGGDRRAEGTRGPALG